MEEENYIRQNAGSKVRDEKEREAGSHYSRTTILKICLHLWKTQEYISVFALLSWYQNTGEACENKYEGQT
jgi:hypothetical protein